MNRYKRMSLEVQAVKYEVGKGLEDGFDLWAKIVMNGWIVQDGLIKITQEDGTIVCPFVQNRRGLIFIREGDYIIEENDCERHVCGKDKFAKRFLPIES
ncbi:hypothetical protein LQZ18_06790 [Lachnospiraceae bacterium ZAX-1]